MSKFNEIYGHEKTSSFSIIFIFNSNTKFSCRLLVVYDEQKFELYLTNLIVGHIIVHYCLLYEKFTLNLSV